MHTTFCATNILINFFVYCKPIDGESFNTKQLSLTTHDLYYLALRCLHKNHYDPDIT